MFIMQFYIVSVGISSTCKTQHSHFIFIFSSDVYVLIINECDVLPMHRKKAKQIIFAPFLDFCGNFVEVMWKSHCWHPFVSLVA